MEQSELHSCNKHPQPVALGLLHVAHSQTTASPCWSRLGLQCRTDTSFSTRTSCPGRDLSRSCPNNNVTFKFYQMSAIRVCKASPDIKFSKSKHNLSNSLTSINHGRLPKNDGHGAVCFSLGGAAEQTTERSSHLVSVTSISRVGD